MSVLQYDMLDVIPSQKFYVNMGPVLTGYGPMDVSCTFCVCACVFYIVFKDINELFGFKKIHKAKEVTLTNYFSCSYLSPCTC
jgi:hypothetical protein